MHDISGFRQGINEVCDFFEMLRSVAW